MTRFFSAADHKNAKKEKTKKQKWLKKTKRKNESRAEKKKRKKAKARTRTRTLLRTLGGSTDGHISLVKILLQFFDQFLVLFFVPHRFFLFSPKANKESDRSILGKRDEVLGSIT